MVAVLVIVLLLIIHGPMQIHNEIKRCCIGYAAFMLGIGYKHIEKMWPNIWRSMGGLGFVVLLILNQSGAIDISSGVITSLLFYICATTAGWGMVRMLALSMKGVMLNAVAYIGNRSLWIVMFHFLSFKLVTFVYLLMTSKNYLLLAKFPTLQGIPAIWILYLLSGVALPLVLEHEWMQLTAFLKDRR